jgi:hypothetical protein
MGGQLKAKLIVALIADGRSGSTVVAESESAELWTDVLGKIVDPAHGAREEIGVSDEDVQLQKAIAAVGRVAPTADLEAAAANYRERFAPTGKKVPFHPPAAGSAQTQAPPVVSFRIAMVVNELRPDWFEYRATLNEEPSIVLVARTKSELLDAMTAYTKAVGGDVFKSNWATQTWGDEETAETDEAGTPVKRARVVLKPSFHCYEYGGDYRADLVVKHGADFGDDLKITLVAATIADLRAQMNQVGQWITGLASAYDVTWEEGEGEERSDADDERNDEAASEDDGEDE